MEQVFVCTCPSPRVFTLSLAALAQHIEGTCLNGVRVKIVEQIDGSPRSTVISVSSRKTDDKTRIETGFFVRVPTRIRDHTALPQHDVD